MEATAAETHLVATWHPEESFNRLETQQGPHTDIPSQPQDVAQVARAIFPSIYKHLLKYLKSRQAPTRHTMDSIMDHLVTYIKYGMSPQSFLAQYLTTGTLTEVRSMINCMDGL